jgi:hypothetical protein
MRHMSRHRAVVEAYRRKRFALLFYSLLLVLAAHPLFELVLPGIDPTEWLMVLLLVAAVATVEVGRRVRSLMVVVAAYLVVRLLHPWLAIPALFSIGQALWMSVLVIVMASAIEHVFKTDHDIAERVFAALDVYLLAGFVFGAAYWVLERELPGSFGPAITDLSFQKAIYLSFFTLTTLGLGNVVPSNGPAMGLMIFEAIAGQLYLTVLVARLVSLYATR